METRDPPDWTQVKLAKHLTIDMMKACSPSIHYFGLGFIQIKVSSAVRFHFYVPELPAITEDLHDHRYPFESRILAGSLKQELWTITSGMTHFLERETCKPGKPNKGHGVPCGVKLIMASEHGVGTTYRITAEAIHRVLPSEAITMVTRDLSGPLSETARVVRSIMAHKVCPFSKKVPEEELWSLVEKTLKNYGDQL